MANQKQVVADPNQYPPKVVGYYAQAFKKSEQEKKELKNMKKLHKKLIADEYGKDYNASQRKKIMNPSNIRLKD